MTSDLGFALDAWHELWVMVGGAAAALAGLLFVAVSINLVRLLDGVDLPRRAAETLGVLLSLLVMAVLGLTPQHSRELGAEVLVLGVVMTVVLIGRLRLKETIGRTRPRRLMPAMVLLAFCVPVLLGGASLLGGVGGGLYWLVVAIVLGFGGAVLNAWVLLVEILR